MFSFKSGVCTDAKTESILEGLSTHHPKNNKGSKSLETAQQWNHLFSTYSPERKQDLEREMRTRIRNLESTRRLDQTFVCLDMDMFFAAVAIREHPELKEHPVAVCNSRIVCTSNYHARKFGVRSAMPLFMAKKLCPRLVCVPVQHDVYHSISQQIHTIFYEYDPSFESCSVDEAILNLSGYMSRTQRVAEDTVQEIRAKIFTTHN